MEQIERRAEQSGKPDSGAAAQDTGEGDELLPAAVDVILETGQASVSFLQRRLKLGYARAARIVDEMEERGIIGPYEGAKPAPAPHHPRAVGADAERHLCPARAARRGRASLICLYGRLRQGAPRLQNKCLRCIRSSGATAGGIPLNHQKITVWSALPSCRARRGAAAS